MRLLINFIIELATIGVLLIIKGPPKLFRFVLGQIKTLGGLALIIGLDSLIFTANLILPLKAKGSVVVKGNPGYGGIWPEFVAPTESDSRSPCPYLSTS